MVAQDAWRELCRFEDLGLARAVATSIAAMEFDVRMSARGPVTDDDAHPGRPPYVIQVEHGVWDELADVLDEIVEEQQEFDRLLAERHTAGHHVRIVTVITLAGAADVLVLLGLIDW